MMCKDQKYMSRALQLASLGAGHTSPNPMVGAVIVTDDDRIIGEGFHRSYGGPHAEVNAFSSIKPNDEKFIQDATMYVTLEPCSHWGKTPPCAALLCEKKIKRVVVGTVDPNPLVAGRGITMLREAGIEVNVNCLSEECKNLNVRFFTAHTLKRPWILLKWAEDEFGRTHIDNSDPLIISNPVTMAIMHAQRAKCDAILVGTNTILTDNPSLTTRLWPGNSPRPVVFDSMKWKRNKENFKLFERNPVILDPKKLLKENMELLFKEYGITSLMVEGGRKIIDSFIAENLYDFIRVEHG